MRAWLRRAGIVLVVAGAMVAPGAADAAHPTTPSSWSATAAADGVRVGVHINEFLAVSDVADAGGPSAQAVLNAFGDAKGYAAYPYPGDVVLTAHGLSQGAAPKYPLIAQSDPTQPKSDVAQGPYQLHSTSSDNRVESTAAAAAGGNGLATGTTSSSAVVTHDPSTRAVTAEAQTTAEGFSFGGVLTIGRVSSHARMSVAPGAKPVRVLGTEFGDVYVGGQQVGITDRGLVLAGTAVPLPPDSTANALLSGAGITVHYVSPSETATSTVAPGLSVQVLQDVPGVGQTTVTYVLGQAAVTAQSSGATADDVGTPGSVTTTPSSPGAAPAEAGSGPAGPVPAAGSSAPVDTGAAPPDAAAPTTAASSPAPVVAGAPVAVSRPSAASLYLVVAIGAIVMVAAAQLFRLLAVRLTWT